jgi:F-type H+-transporting ATPase subunit delta
MILSPSRPGIFVRLSNLIVIQVLFIFAALALILFSPDNEEHLASDIVNLRQALAKAGALASNLISVDSGNLAKWSSMLELLSALSSDASVRSALEHPALTQQQRASLLMDLCGDQIDRNGMNFVSVLSEYERISLLPEISHLFELLKANHEKTVEVVVNSAYEISDEDNSRLTEILKEKLHREVHIEARVDKSLMGGLVIKTDDTVIDKSIRGKLAKLAQAMNS